MKNHPRLGKVWMEEIDGRYGAETIEKIRCKECTYEKASNESGIPVGTLASRISRNSNGPVGCPTALNTNEEKHLVDLILTLQSYGELSAIEDVLKYASEFVEIMHLESRFKNDQPTREWYYTFITRWKTKLNVMTSRILEKARADVTVSTVDGWFAKLYSILAKYDLFNKPEQIFNCDESGFRDDPGKKNVVVSRDTKYANKVHGGSGKDRTTVLLTISASGICFPPYVIYKARPLHDIWCPRNAIRGTVYNCTDSGWINEETFFDYLKNMLIPLTKNIPHPLLLIFDGHTSHLSLKTARLATGHQIHLLCLPAYSTHLLQPLDVYTLKYVKAQWRSLLWDYNNRNSSKKLDKPDFIRLYRHLYDYALLPTHCSSAFRKAGIFPYDPRVVKRDRLVKTSTSSSTVAMNTFRRSKSVGFDYNDNQPTTITPIPLQTSYSNKRREVVKYPSNPSLFSGYGDADKSNEPETSSNDAQHVISQLDTTITTLDSIMLSMPNTSIRLSTNQHCPTSFDSSTCTTNDDLPDSSVSTMHDMSSFSPTANSSMVSAIFFTSREEDPSLVAIEKIVAKHFLGRSSNSTRGKRHIASSGNDRNVTDLNENSKKVINARAQSNVSTVTANTMLHEPMKSVAIATSQSTALPPITYMLTSDASPTISSFHSSVGICGQLQSLTQTSTIQCHLCFNIIQALETTSNCHQCYKILCWKCSTKMNDAYQLCYPFRSFYANQQHNYYSYTQL
ncbi:unnamed protein product [Adineta ricciae]|uniref:DDE-1 domain-containing protein n=1 Tax=Adineta ricciae TaxID=249248 RepID=A0A816FLZ6_ADIRI|nr:unnamed protein product [Adineta ricciae]CAF1663427.1 unnamed protein product [Adineta ricciae]